MRDPDSKTVERLARESADLARKALKKTNELEVYLGLREYRASQVREIKSVRDYFRSLRSA